MTKQRDGSFGRVADVFEVALTLLLGGSAPALLTFADQEPPPPHFIAGSPPDRAKMMDIFRRHGMTLASPPVK